MNAPNSLNSRDSLTRRNDAGWCRLDENPLHFDRLQKFSQDIAGDPLGKPPQFL